MEHHLKIHSALFIVFSVLFIVLIQYSERPEKARASGIDQRSTDAAEDWAPYVVPYLDSVPSPMDGQGTAIVTPSGELQVGSRKNFEITFTVGEKGIVSGGFVMLQISPWWGWSQPQTLYPKKSGYTVVRTSFSDPSFKVHTLPMSRILVFSTQRSFGCGETITFSYGNDPRIDKYAEAEELFQIFVDADGDGHSACIADPPMVHTIARPASRLNVTTQSQGMIGKTIEVVLSPLDSLGNWSTFPAGKYKVKATRDGRTLVSMTREARGGEKTIAFLFTPNENGVYFFDAEGPLGLKGRSNVMLCQESAPILKLYFGDIHGHSRMSDGTGTPEDYYRYARTVSGLDVAALTDHSDYGTIPIKGKVWERIKKATNDAYVPYRFVTFLGFEWTNWRYGHRNVYYRDGQGPVFRSIDGVSSTPQKLWNLIKPFEAMTVAHHVGGGPVATDWDVVPGPNEWLVEISSIHGSSEYYRGEACIYNPVKGTFVRDALLRGYKLGIIGSGDTHDGHPGQRSAGAVVAGLMGVYSPELTRQAVWEAFRRRHVYATSGPKIILNFRVADSPMGSEVKWAVSKGPVPVLLRAVGCDDIGYAEIIRNGETVFVEKGEGVFLQFLADDSMPSTGTHWYYARILQEDGNMAWSSPIWVTLE